MQNLRFSAGHFGRKNRTETHKKTQKRAKMHKNAPLCTDACNTPVYYTPVSVHPISLHCYGTENRHKRNFCPEEKRYEKSEKCPDATPKFQNKKNQNLLNCLIFCLIQNLTHKCFFSPPQSCRHRRAKLLA